MSLGHVCRSKNPANLLRTMEYKQLNKNTDRRRHLFINRSPVQVVK